MFQACLYYVICLSVLATIQLLFTVLVRNDHLTFSPLLRDLNTLNFEDGNN